MIIYHDEGKFLQICVEYYCVLKINEYYSTEYNSINKVKDNVFAQ